jgi:hypothetical protein
MIEMTQVVMRSQRTIWTRGSKEKVKVMALYRSL